MSGRRVAFELLEEGIVRLTYHVPVTADVFRQASLDRVAFAADHVGGPYVLIVDYTQTTLTPSVLNLRLNAWSTQLDPNMLEALLISRSTIAMTGANIARRLTGRPVTVCATQEEALEQARHILKQHRDAARQSG